MSGFELLLRMPMLSSLCHTVTLCNPTSHACLRDFTGPSVMMDRGRLGATATRCVLEPLITASVPLAANPADIVGL
jgi:hypothetical protein